MDMRGSQLADLAAPRLSAGRAEGQRSARRIVAISDYCGTAPRPAKTVAAAGCDRVRVTGGYLERLPLAAVAAGLADAAEVWSFADCGGAEAWVSPDLDRPRLERRGFQAIAGQVPFRSAALRTHVQEAGAPDILCVWGLGVEAAILDDCAASIRIYNSIDASPLRIPDEEAARFDLFLTGSEWQSQAIRARVPGARTLVLPIGPEFASGETFHPTGVTKDRDVVYVACAQGYKRHHVLFDALERLPGTTALLVIGYGEQADDLRRDVERRGLDVEIIGPPGASHDEVNRQMNRARVGVVCGIEDGAPAILTEYMLAGLPVLANAGLSCGLQYITPKTGLAAAEGPDFAAALDRLLATAAGYDTRAHALAHWGWPASIARLAVEIDAIRLARRRKDHA